MRYSIEGKILADIVDAINAKTGGTAALAPGDMADEIDSISGGGVTVEPLSVTQNGTYTAPSGKAYSPVTVEYQHPSSLTKRYKESLYTLEKNFIPQLPDEFRSMYNKIISPTFNEVLAYFFSD